MFIILFIDFLVVFPGHSIGIAQGIRTDICRICWSPAVHPHKTLVGSEWHCTGTCSPPHEHLTLTQTPYRHLHNTTQFHRHCTGTWHRTITVSQSGIELHSQIKMAVTYKLVTQLIKGISPHILRFMDDCLTVSITSSNRWYDDLYIFLKGRKKSNFQLHPRKKFI